MRVIKTYVAASRKQPEENSHIEVIIKTTLDSDAKAVEKEIKKAALNLSRKMKKKLTFEIICVIRNSF